MNRPAVIVHCLDDCRTALGVAAETRIAITLRSAPGAAAYLGAPAFKAMVETARSEYPDVDVEAVLDCGNDPGMALAAFRYGLDRVRVDLASEVRARVADIAAQCGAALDDSPAPALDLGAEADPFSSCRSWLTKAPKSSA